jgi:uncharacterized repeat protein (TIGR01451 family)
MWKIVFKACSAAFVLITATPALSAPIEISNAVFQEVETRGPDGAMKRTLAPAVTVTPGDEVVYVLTIRNTGASPAEQLVITNPLPQHVAFVAAAAGSTAPKVSVGGERFGALSDLSVVTADGRSRPAQAGDVTHIRWDLAAPLAPNSEQQVSYRGQLK